MEIKYYDIGLNLFCKQFPNPETVIENAAAAGVCCILTGTDRRENQQIDRFVRDHDAFGTAGIHPHNADSARKEDFEQMERLLTENDRILAVGECGLDFDRILIETDAPYLVPKNVEGLGRINVPENIVYVAREVARYRNVPEEELILHARQNTERIFGISERPRGSQCVSEPEPGKEGKASYE